MKFCSECGSKIINGTSSCTNCGARFESSPKLVKAGMGEAMKFCDSCGSKLIGQTSSCTNCGAKIGTDNKSVEKTTNDNPVPTPARVWAFISLGLGIESLFCSLFSFIPFSGTSIAVTCIISATVGFFFAFNSMKKGENSKSKIGLVLCIVAVAISVFGAMISYSVAKEKQEQKATSYYRYVLPEEKEYPLFDEYDDYSYNDYDYDFDDDWLDYAN